MSIILVRFYDPEQGPRVGAQKDAAIYDVTAHYSTTADWFRSSVGRVTEAIHDLETLIADTDPVFIRADLNQMPTADRPHWLAPVDGQEVWASGVTYERSRTARQLEAVDGGDVYARVYGAERPELFMKAAGWRVVGHLGYVGIRRDAAWSVPEPELALALNPAMEVVGFSIGNDMSSRDIEGENPLYLPQAKMYTASCALGPGITLQEATSWPDTEIRITITRTGKTVFNSAVDTRQIHRQLGELVDYLGRAYTFPDGVILLTGTGIVPPDEFALEPGDSIVIEIDGIGKLVNTVRHV